MKFIKRIAKVFVFILIFNVICGLGFLGYFSFSVFGPSIKNADISLLDIVKSDLTQEQEVKIDNLLKENGKRIGFNAASKVKGVLLKIFPPVDYDYSDVEEIQYPYPSPSEVVDMNNQKTKEALKEGLEILKQMDKDNEYVKKKSLQESK